MLILTQLQYLSALHCTHLEERNSNIDVLLDGNPVQLIGFPGGLHYVSNDVDVDKCQPNLWWSAVVVRLDGHLGHRS